MVMRRTALVVSALVVVSVLVGAIAWFGPWHDRSSAGGGSGGKGRNGPQTDPARALAGSFAQSWQRGDLAKVPFTAASGDAAAKTRFLVARLAPDDDDHPTKVDLIAVKRRTSPAAGTDPATSDGPSSRVATVRVTWDLGSGRSWTYDTNVPLEKRLPPTASTAPGTLTTTGDAVDPKDLTWQVAWTPAVVEPSLVEGEALTSVRNPAPRGEILRADGQPLLGAKGAVEVGIQPRRTPDPAGTARQVAALVGIDPVALVGKVQAAPPDAFVSVTVLERPAYDAIRDRIQPLPGTVFREVPAPGAPPPGFARAVLGAVGPATKATADASGGAIVEGDPVGQSGIQYGQQAVLGGTPGLTVRTVPTPGGTARELKTFPGTPGRPVTVTLDTRVQQAADAVMAGAPKPAALVAIRPITGDVLAVANGPTGLDGYNRAMVGHYPPGSTFKVASGLTYLQQGLTLDTPVDCPPTITIGKVFKNAGGEVLGPVPFRKDFAESCNTAFVGLARTVTYQQLADTAGLLGYRKLDVGAPLFGGLVPADGDATEHAADVIGQGKVDASPFAVALASASVAAGHSVEPRLIIDPTKPAPPPGADLPPGPLASLREAMRGVVTEGTGTKLNGVPGGDVFAKTGTAEFGTASPPQTHAWFTGYQGDLAFTVLVEDGGFGGEVAAPLAAQFLTKLATG